MSGDGLPRVTELLARVQAGEAHAVDELLPLVYAELRRLARGRLKRERSGTGHQPTSLVHEAYLRLVGSRQDQWEGRAHFFAAAAEAMRRILIERARHRAAEKYGGGRRRVSLDESALSDEPHSVELMALDQALERLEKRDPEMGNVVKLRYFAGLTIPETGDALNLSPRTVNRQWTAAKAWLRREMSRSGGA